MIFSWYQLASFLILLWKVKYASCWVDCNIEKILSLMLSGGEYLFSLCKKQIDFLIYMYWRKENYWALLFFFKKERQFLFFMHHLQSTYPASRCYIFTVWEQEKMHFLNLFVQISGRIWTVISRGYFLHDSSHSKNVTSLLPGYLQSFSLLKSNSA